MVKKYYILNTKGVNILDIGELLSNGEGYFKIEPLR